MEFVKVHKGTLETSVNKKQLKNYLDNGWEIVTEKPKPKPKTYDVYTKEQLLAMCQNRNLLARRSETKTQIIDKLLTQDGINETVQNKPTNKGFTDNLIIE